MVITLSYGSHPDQVADAVAPTGTAAGPLILFLHGGFWRAAHDRHHVTHLAQELAGHGYAVANVEYRRTGAGGGFPATLLDVALAADRLPDLVEAALPGRVDRDRVVYAGHSAGGHLAVWAALRDRLPAGAPGRIDALPPVAGVLALAPVLDLAEAYRAGGGSGAVAEFLGAAPREDPQRYAAADPAALGKATVPITIVHGDRDELVPAAMSREYAAATGATLVEPVRTNHFDLIDPASAAWPAILDALRSMTSRAPHH